VNDQRIVLFDDSSLMRRLLTGLLSEAGYNNVTAFSTLSDGWDYLDHADVQVNLILMDKAMPDGDGIDAIKRIRATAHLADKPVIMVTGFNDRDTLRAAFDAGATDFINKSFDEAELQTRVRSALKLDAALTAYRERETELYLLTAQLKTANRQLERQSLTDGLTGVANRRHFDQALENAWLEANEHGLSIAVAMLDVDQFKRYNDSFGHGVGDECLQRVAQQLERVVRSAGGRDSDLIARYGGEEFAAILTANRDQAALIAERLRSSIEALQRPHPHSSVAAVVTISVGVAVITPSSDSSPAGLCAAADAALYAAKNAGRNRVVVSDQC
jgi:two-component system, chemotaxis family, response regulator WspR